MSDKKRLAPLAHTLHGTRPKIWLVWASNYGDDGSLLRAFFTEGAAQDFCDKCLAYDRTRPEPPRDIEDSPENDAEHNRWWKRLQRWQKRHPGGPDAWTHNTFTVQSFRLDPR